MGTGDASNGSAPGKRDVEVPSPASAPDLSPKAAPPRLPLRAPGSSSAPAPAEGRVEPKAVRFVVVALILRGDSVLICQRRADQPMAHKWEFPGGKMEAGETAEQALARELDEELSIRAEIGSRIIRLRHTYRSGGAVDLQFFVVHRFEGELTNNIFQQMRWCELRNLPAYDFLAADRSLIRDLAAGKLL